MIKECIRCKGLINTSKDKYVVVKDIDCGKNIKTLYYHKECWHEVMTGKGRLNNMIKRAGNIFNFAEDKLDIPKEEKYEVIA